MCLYTPPDTPEPTVPLTRKRKGTTQKTSEHKKRIVEAEIVEAEVVEAEPGQAALDESARTSPPSVFQAASYAAEALAMFGRAHVFNLVITGQ